MTKFYFLESSNVFLEMAVKAEGENERGQMEQFVRNLLKVGNFNLLDKKRTINWYFEIDLTPAGKVTN